MSSDSLYEKYAYVTYEDIMKLNKDGQNNTLLAIRAPKGSTLEVVEPDEDETDPMYQLQINSKDHEIQVFQLNNQDEGHDDEEPTQEKPPVKEDASELDDM